MASVLQKSWHVSFLTRQVSFFQSENCLVFILRQVSYKNHYKCFAKIMTRVLILILHNMSCFSLRIYRLFSKSICVWHVLHFFSELTLSFSVHILHFPCKIVRLVMISCSPFTFLPSLIASISTSHKTDYSVGLGSNLFSNLRQSRDSIYGFDPTIPVSPKCQRFPVNT
jgi:hypothetical protein